MPFTCLLSLILLASCTGGATGVSAPPVGATSTAPAELLSVQAMADLAKATKDAAKPSASLDVLRVEHHGLPPLSIGSPLKRHACWSVYAGEDPLEGYPDLDYLCVSDQALVYYPVKEADFNAMLAGEDRSTWGDAEYIQAATLWIHLLDPSRQHSGWTPLNTGEDLLGLTFNMQAENLPERKKVAARIVPPKRVSNGDTHTVELFSWTIISGPVHHWTFVFTPHGVRHSKEQLGRFGGGGYD